MYLRSMRVVHQNASKWRKVIMVTSVYIQFWKYFKKLFLFVLLLLLFIFFWLKYVLKLLRTYVQNFTNMLIGFRLMDFASNWCESAQGVHKWPGSNRVNFCNKEFEKFTLYSFVSQSQVLFFVYFVRIIIWRVNIKFS